MIDHARSTAKQSSFSTVELQTVTDFILDGTHGSPEHTADGVPLLSAKNVHDGNLEFDVFDYVSEQEYDSFRHRLHIVPSDVVLTIVGSIGRTAVVETTRPFVLLRSVAVIRPKKEMMDPRYLRWVLESPRMQERLHLLTKQGSQPGVYLGEVRQIAVPQCDLGTQQRIVAKLDEQMAALERAEKALAEQQAAASVLTAATLQQIFSGCGSKRWRTLPIDDLCQASISTWDTSAHPQEQKEYIEIAGIDPMSKTIGNTRFVQACTAPSRARNVVHTGDIIIATTRPNLNAVAVVPPDLDNQVCSTGFAVLRPNELVISRWLYWSVRSPDFIRTVSDLVVGAMYPAVTDKQVTSVVIPVPPIPEQECLVARLDQQTVHLGLVLRALEDQEAELAALRSTLLDVAFSGEV
jgi:restriction endonuclease S subunit